MTQSLITGTSMCFSPMHGLLPERTADRFGILRLLTRGFAFWGGMNDSRLADYQLFIQSAGIDPRLDTLASKKRMLVITPGISD